MAGAAAHRGEAQQDSGTARLAGRGGPGLPNIDADAVRRCSAAAAAAAARPITAGALTGWLAARAIAVAGVIRPDEEVKIGFMNRLCPWISRVVDSPWKMYPVGVLFVSLKHTKELRNIFTRLICVFELTDFRSLRPFNALPRCEPPPLTR